MASGRKRNKKGKGQGPGKGGPPAGGAPKLNIVQAPPPKKADARPSHLRWLPIVALLILLVIFFGPRLLWELTPARPMRVVVLDKTVPEPDRREHLGFFWAMAHFKVPRPDGKPYDALKDYFGYFPLPNKRYQVREFPDPVPPSDLIYLADSYGVYTHDLDPELAKHGERSRLIYGGLLAKEAKAVQRAVDTTPATLIAEFNDFATPTRQDAREVMYQTLGLRWTGWMGRYFTDLRKGVEVPDWLVRNYEAQHRKKWDFRGPGIAFTHNDDRCEVLRDRTDVGPDYVEIAFSKEAVARYHVREKATYSYWFDIVQPTAGTQTLATFRVDATESGQKLLQARGIPERFPAVLRRDRPGGGPRYYLAGDFADARNVPGLTRYAGLDGLNFNVQLRPDVDPESFFWAVYVPFLKQVFQEIAPVGGPAAALAP